MKKIVLGLMMVLFTMTANAQFEAGKKYIGASVSGLNLSYSKQSKTTFDLSATAGAFVFDDWMVTGQLGYNHVQDANLFEIGLGWRYYIAQNGIYLGLGALYAHSDSGDGSDFKTDNFFITPEIGYAFFINEYLTIEPAVYYRMSLNDFSDGSTVGLKVGLGFYF